MKKGVIEIADLLIVNKTDGDNIQRAELARTGYQRVLHYLQPATQLDDPLHHLLPPSFPKPSPPSGRPSKNSPRPPAGPAPTPPAANSSPSRGCTP